MLLGFLAAVLQLCLVVFHLHANVCLGTIYGEVHSVFPEVIFNSLYSQLKILKKINRRNYNFYKEEVFMIHVPAFFQKKLISKAILGFLFSVYHNKKNFRKVAKPPIGITFQDQQLKCLNFSIIEMILILHCYSIITSVPYPNP